MEIRVTSVDPAPTKAAIVFDGRFDSWQIGELAHRVDELAKDSNVLLCWDAPLTGPASEANAGGIQSDFYYRVIEMFFSRGAFKCPKGISVRPYAGCSHWAITRHVLGLPRIGRYELPEDSLSYSLLPQPDPHSTRSRVVEIHPAVAIWLWCNQLRDAPLVDEWEYKANRFERIRGLLFERWRGLELSWLTSTLDSIRWPKHDDDHLDALVGWVLGRLYLEAGNHVILLGDRSTGSFLVPNIGELKDAFEIFRSNSSLQKRKRRSRKLTL